MRQQGPTPARALPGAGTGGRAAAAAGARLGSARLGDGGNRRPPRDVRTTVAYPRISTLSTSIALRTTASPVLVALVVLLSPVAAACSSDSPGAEKPTPKTTTTEGSSTSVVTDDPTASTTGTTGSTVTTTTAPTTTSAPATTTTIVDVPGPSTTTTTVATNPAPPRPATAEEQPYIDVLIDLSLDPENNDFPLERAQAQCIIPRWVSAIGVDRFKGGGVAPTDLRPGGDGADHYLETIDTIGDTESAQGMVDALAPCGLDLVTYVAGVIAGDEGATAEQEACFVKNLPLDAVEVSLMAALDGDDSTSSDLEEPISSAAESCIS